MNIINDTQSVELEKSALFFEGSVAQNIKTGNNPLDMFRNNKSELHEKVGKIIGFDTSSFSLHVFNSEGVVNNTNWFDMNIRPLLPNQTDRMYDVYAVLRNESKSVVTEFVNGFGQKLPQILTYLEEGKTRS